MRVIAIEVGKTYRVHIPRRDDPLRYLTHDPTRSGVDHALTELAMSRIHDFDLTVISADQQLGGERAVTGVRGGTSCASSK